MSCENIYFCQENTIQQWWQNILPNIEALQRNDLAALFNGLIFRNLLRFIQINFSNSDLDLSKNLSLNYLSIFLNLLKEIIETRN